MSMRCLQIYFFLGIINVLVPNAWAANSGIDTSEKNAPLTFAVGGNVGMELSPTGASGTPDLFVFGNTSLSKKLSVANTALFESNVGIGSSAPVTSLDVNGAIKVGTTNQNCTASLTGAIRYNTSTGSFEGCNGSVWSPLGNAGLRHCRVCFWSRGWDGGTQNSQCTNTSGCSDWSTSPAWSPPINDDTDNRGGGCFYSFMLQCE